MNAQDPLAQMRDIHLPETGGWWPPAVGWWWLTLILLLVLVGAFIWWRHRRKRTQWRRDALRELKALRARAENHPRWFGELNGLLKRAAREAFPEHHPETLTGEQWVEFLLTTAPDDQPNPDDTVNAMVAACWQPAPTVAPDDALRFAKAWLEAQP
ncbi:MAG: DUF4381 domain-containing protein [Marinobacter sp.]